MKKIFKNINLSATTAILGVVLVASSCNKITDLQPNNSFSEESAYSSPARVALAVTGVYSAAQMGSYAGSVDRGYPFGAANTEQQDARGEDVIAVPSFYLITYEGTYSPTTANNQGMWETSYALINRANVVIEGVKKAAAAGVITPALATQYEAESRYLRALAHHELLVHFARPYSHTAGATHLGVPYRTVAASSPAGVDINKSQGRNTVKECYDKLLEDLNFAEANLPESYAAGLKVSRATKGAAIAIKTRIYLHMGSWANVITEGNKLISSNAPFTSPIGGYSLTATPSGPFITASNFTNSESIFSIENSTTRNAGTNGSISTMYTKAAGRALLALSPIIYNSSFWLPTDLRRTTMTTNDGRGYFTTKYPEFSTFTDANPIIRYAEVLLNVAEAEARTTALSSRALALLNAVRNRAVTTAANQFTIANFASGNDLVQAVLNERRIEFLAEGHRWGDIHRLANDANFSTGGIPSKVAWTGTTFASWNPSVPYSGARTVSAIPYTDFRFIWPLPQSEISTNPVLAAQQNPNY
ncbi:RagB/SusD family nutrient uptake outer membrane protein [Pedobacter sp. Leaf132]|uniref:RagB/SusD family nutrient uptake outer membrane protein n=1 Tax=Pedobacter sp. Leaf132 TaxID=2876557 RepID=UPI001E5D59A5|nr:RagB/SusD family nutrient uptake outer membrane protein [Pedobacter sp. Leaf132]